VLVLITKEDPALRYKTPPTASAEDWERVMAFI